jgi:hypothetical protein
LIDIKSFNDNILFNIKEITKNNNILNLINYIEKQKIKWEEIKNELNNNELEEFIDNTNQTIDKKLIEIETINQNLF